MGGGAEAAPTATTVLQQDNVAKNKKAKASVSRLFNPLGSLLGGSDKTASPAQDVNATAPKTLLVRTITENEGGDNAMERGAPDALAKPHDVQADARIGNATVTNKEAATLHAEVIDLQKNLNESKSDGEAARRDRAMAMEEATSRQMEVTIQGQRQGLAAGPGRHQQGGNVPLNRSRGPLDGA